MDVIVMRYQAKSRCNLAECHKFTEAANSNGYEL